MAFFQKCRCLQSGSTLPLRVLWKFARLSDSHGLSGLSLLKRSGLLRGNIGIACPSCGAKFRIVQTRIQIVRLIVWAVFLGAAWYAGEWSRRVNVPLDPRFEMPVLLVGVLGIGFFERICFPHLAQVRPASDAEGLSFPLRSAYEGGTDRGPGELL
jgi:hypothetical protein